MPTAPAAACHKHLSVLERIVAFALTFDAAGV